jgi:hypothetical protein
MKTKYFAVLFISLLFVSGAYSQQIAVSSPNGGESLTAGVANGINWSDNIKENVSIKLYTGGQYY